MHSVVSFNRISLAVATGFVRNSAYFENRSARENSRMETMILDTLRWFSSNLRNPMNRPPAPFCLFIILPLLACFAFLTGAQAICQEGCDSTNFNAFLGDDALISNTLGAGNAAFGWRSLFSNIDGSFNTGVGGGALALNNGTSNTAVGAAALLLNTTGAQNTAIGTDTLVFNDSGIENTAVGYFALMNNTIGGANTAIGWETLTTNTSGNNNTAIGVSALESNIDGTSNTALGNRALNTLDHGGDNTAVGHNAGEFITSGSNNMCLGEFSGYAITTGSGIIAIGPVSGVHSIFGQVDDRTYIANILNAAVDAGTAQLVYVDADGRLGTFLATAGPESSISRPSAPKANPDAQAMLNRKVEALETTVAELRAQLKEQAAQIQKVSAQPHLKNSAAKTVATGQ
jgi:hypothetical protein